ncbi:MAG: glycosyltransferase, partial [Nitrososphaerota archaeon]
CALSVYDFVDKTWIEQADLSVRKRFPKDKKIVVMACGTGHPLEHPDLLIESSKGFSDLVIAITGNSDYLRTRINTARSLGTTNVILTGFLPDEQYRGLIATCDFVANISDEPYGIPHTLTEGLAAGRPVITSGNPSVIKLLGHDYPLIVPHNDIENIRKVISIALKRQDELMRQANRLYEKLKEKRERQLKRLMEFLKAS